MRTLRVNLPGREYDIHIEGGLLDRIPELIKETGLSKSDGRITVVTDSNVAPLYADKVIRGLSGYETKLIVVDAGESAKSIDNLKRLYGEMLDFKMTRTDLIIALGGGVVGDLTGFAAATILRGIPYVQIPTTLLAQVDSSVGGKTAVNLPQGKNLVGAFYQPKMVIIDTDCLKTLPPETLADGMAEVIKYGAIADRNLFVELKNIKNNENNEELFAKIPEIVYTCCNIKRKIVEADERDTGKRMILNFGHTYGHTIEKHYNFSTYTHGMAVAAGMIMACRRGESMGITPAGTADEVEAVVKKYGLPTSADISHDELVHAVAVDKKGDGDSINLILLKSIGDAVICKTKKTDI